MCRAVSIISCIRTLITHAAAAWCNCVFIHSFTLSLSLSLSLNTQHTLIVSAHTCDTHAQHIHIHIHTHTFMHPLAHHARTHCMLPQHHDPCPLVHPVADLLLLVCVSSLMSSSVPVPTSEAPPSSVELVSLITSDAPNDSCACQGDTATDTADMTIPASTSATLGALVSSGYMVTAIALIYFNKVRGWMQSCDGSD